MGRVTAGISVQVNLTTIFSAYDLKNKYLSGLPIPNSITDDNLQWFIDASITEVENYLGLKLMKQIITENKDFFKDDWEQWGFIECSYPVVCPVSLAGFLGTVQQILYPPEWISARKTSDNRWYSRQMHVVPTTIGASSNQLIYSGIIPQIGYNGSRQIPNYWNIQYVTGWTNVPSDILNVVGMLSAYKVLQLISDALMVGAIQKITNAQGQQILASNGTSFGGLGFGVASKSISIDGLSQSTSSYANGTTGVWGARMKQYADMLDPSKSGSLMNRLYDQYGAITMGVA